MSPPNVLIRLKYYKPEDAELSPDNPINQRKIKNRNYYSSKQSNGEDYMKYMDKGAKAGEVYDYMSYAGNEEKSSGVFGKDGLEVVRKNLPKFFKNNGMQDENVVWFAGMHENTDNKHIHVCFFEKEPTFLRQKKKGYFYHTGTMRKTSLNDMKVAIEEQMNGNEYFFASYRRELMRQAEIGLAAHNGYSALDRKLRLKLKELYRKLPYGRISYNSLNMVELRPLVREIERILLERSPVMSEEYKSLKKALDEKDAEIKAICERQKIDCSRYLQKDKFIEDYHRRIGNKIIQYAKRYRYEEGREDRNYESQRIKRSIEKAKRTRLFKETARLTREVDYEAIDVFTEYRRRLAEAEYQRLVEEGVIEAE